MSARRKTAEKMIKHRRQMAMERAELRWQPEPRAFGCGVTTPALKVVAPETQRLIDEAVGRRRST